VGVPEIAPVVAFSANPTGNAGDIVYPVTVPLTVGVSCAMAVPAVALIEVCG
jgi:hypothetical protein